MRTLSTPLAICALLSLLVGCSNDAGSNDSGSSRWTPEAPDVVEWDTGSDTAPTCRDDCSSLMATRCSGEVIETCEDHDDDNCLEWDRTSTCTDGSTCKEGECIPACTDECESSGTRRCHEDGPQTCVDQDEDPCLEWSEPDTCGDRRECRDGSCQLPLGSSRWASGVASSGRRLIVEDVAVAPDGASYVTGLFEGDTDFGDTTYETPSPDRADAFVAKLDATGTFQWAHTFGGQASWTDDRGTGIVVDSSGAIHATGYFVGQATVDGQDFRAGGQGLAMFLFEFDPSGNLQTGHTYANVWAHALAIDANDNLYVTGKYRASNPTLGLARHREADLFAAKFDTAGQLIWSRSPTGETSGNERGRDIAVDPDGRVFVTGTYDGDFRLDDQTSFTHAAKDDLFLLALDASGETRWSSNISTGGNDRGRALAADSNGAVYLTGGLGGTITFGGESLATNLPYMDLFLAKWDRDGKEQWGYADGGADKIDQGDALTVGPDDTIYVAAGVTGAIDFGDGHTTPDPEYLDSVIASLQPDGSVRWLRMLTNQRNARTTALHHTDGRLTAAGRLLGTTDFGPTTLGASPDSQTAFLTELVP
jgi:hypothetical protein